MKSTSLFKLFTVLLVALAACTPVHKDDSPVARMAQRLFPQHADSFVFVVEPDSTGTDRFALESVDGKIVITANNNNSLAVGLNHYLKNFCDARVSWFAADSVIMPEVLPMIPSRIEAEATVDNRFFLNYCTFGYSMPYWKWADWERMIDWMALNGVNMPLAITGQESVWYEVWREMGLTDEQIRNYFTGPAQLPWHRMSNVDYWQSPLPMSWLEDQAELQKKILEREREFDMTPVLPAFSGHVPGELKELFPDARIHQMSQWGGYDDKYRSHFIEPMDSLYGVIQKKFLQKQTEMYGTDHIYGIDPFNEVDSPDWNEQFLSEVSKRIYGSIAEIDPDATWLQMTWMFYHSKDKWTQPRIEAFLTAVPDGKLILLDYYCDNTEIWRQTDRYYGAPYIWCYLGNFGGNTMLAGNIDQTDARIDSVMTDGGKNLTGLGVTLEGLDINPHMYELVFDKAWTDFPGTDVWVDQWARSRGGDQDPLVISAWRTLHDSIYTHEATCGQAVLINARPMLVGTDSWNTYPDYFYDNSTLWGVWQALLAAEVDLANPGHNFDVVNVGRQALGNLFSDFRDQFTAAYNAGNIDSMKLWASRIDQLIADSDRLLATDQTFSLGKWIADARDFGTSPEEKDYYEENARGILTVWGQKATQLNDYANRGWAGLTNDFYGHRWRAFTDAVISAAEAGKPYDPKAYYDYITDWEEQWTRDHKTYPVVSGENPVAVGRELAEKYQTYFK